MRYPVGGANSTRVTDWSREGRRKKSLVKKAGDIKQTCITQYYDIVNEIERLSNTNEVLSMLQWQSPDELPFSTVQRIVHGNYDTWNEGEFRFDGLANHIAKHNTVNLVSVGEDATSIICRVEYDARTNRCVGFVLLLKGGLPEVDSFLATSFDAIY